MIRLEGEDPSDLARRQATELWHDDFHDEVAPT
jgi:hypothetical protein